MTGKTLGILGGGQLGRMAAIAAAQLGIRVHIFSPEPDSPAAHVAPANFVADWDNKDALREFAESVDVITYEFENIPLDTIRYLQTMKPVYPDDRLLGIAQHRVREKKFLNDIGVPTARWTDITKAGQIDRAMTDMGIENGILKTAQMGYDGKGQVAIARGDDAKTAWKSLRTDEAVLEERIDFVCEISVIIARDKLAQMALYGPILNEHKNHILVKSTVPAPIPDEMAGRARRMAELIAEAVDLIGVLCVEMFVTRDGRLLANEIAPRPHNSGHWTIEACTCSQFEQQVRTVTGMQVGAPNRHADAVMVNLLGADVLKIDKHLETPNAAVHIYGKGTPRDGRKMGHVTTILDKTSTSY